MSEMNQGVAAPKRTSLLPLWILLVVFAVPSIAAWWFLLNPDHLPDSRKNLGELIEPPVALDARYGLRGLQGVAFDAEPMLGKWVVVNITRGACDPDCRDKLIALRQIRLAVGEDRFVVDRLMIATESGEAAALATEFSGMQVALIDPRGLEMLWAALPEGERADSQIYIMDPMGNLMMRYAGDAPVKDVLRDLEHLLKASKSWIKGAASHGNR